MNSGNLNLFSELAGGVPLAVRMRPQTIDEVVGQARALRKGTPLRRMIEDAAALSVILWGPPGTGKTTMALLLSKVGGRRFQSLSAAEVGVKEVRDAINDAKQARASEGKQSVLFVDEIHRFSKSQQDSLLGAVENGWISLIAATTENPSFSIINPLLSRSTLVKLEPLSDADLQLLIKRALEDERGFKGEVSITDDALAYLTKLGGGDGRKTLTLLDAGVGAAISEGLVQLTLETLELSLDARAPLYDRNGSEHYDTISAFIKSIRGSDVDAALHYLAKMIRAGEDPRFIARRLLISASEDIGTADAGALTVATNAHQAVSSLGMPEASYALAQATIQLALAPKSNAVAVALAKALADVDMHETKTPPHLSNQNTGSHPKYRDPHLDPSGVIKEEYIPRNLKGSSYYQPKEVGFEMKFKERLAWLKGRLGR